MSAVSRLSSAAMVAATLAFAAPAHAQVTFTGFTNGCFSLTTCVPGTTSGNTTDTYGNLTYRTATFDGTTSNIDGFLGLGDAPGNPNIGNLGSFSLANGDFNYNPGNFVLRVTFTAPAGVAPSSQLFTADILGSVTGTNGGVQIDFDNNPLVFTYTGGTFTFQLNDVALIRNAASGTTSDVALTGFIRTSSVVPEPGTYMLMATGLVGLGLVSYRRRQR